jgi:hypothetical protein
MDVSESDAPERHEVTHPRRKEEELKNSKKEIKHTGAIADATSPSASKVFDEQFWPKYPKRDGSNPRKTARNAFMVAVKSGHDPDAIVGGAERYAASLRKSNQIGTRYVAQAVTWLHQARWEDYPPVVSAETTGPPQPPDSSLPSHEELKRKYEQIDDGQQKSTENGSGVRGESASLCGRAESGPQDRSGVANNQGKHAGMASMAQVFYRSPQLRALGDAACEDWRSERDDGSGSVA